MKSQHTFKLILIYIVIFNTTLIANELFQEGGSAVNYLKKELDEETFCMAFGLRYSMRFNQDDNSLEHNNVMQKK